MLLTINGDLNKYYIQTLCMLFCPGAKFSEHDDDSGVSAVFTRTDSGDEVSATRASRRQSSPQERRLSRPERSFSE